ncbi:protein obstructor-E, partial [Agrilus planipennis]|uniref:Protein obstructor-E n=1 Tax=Agrilus planipennis TaxID=224129 RepID=A0A1W4W557_AGRPL
YSFSYIECDNGVAEEKLCPDGLLFNANSSFFNYPCQYPNEVDCRGRSSVQPAQPTEDCPHQFGLYKYGDARNCGQFKNCANGIAYIIDCPEGLAFNEETYKCDWPDQVPSCDAEAYLGFSCPNARKNFNGFELEEENRLYRSSTDCQQYFLCFNGRPRLLRCGEDEVFNEEISTCEKIENSGIRCSQFNTRSQSGNKQSASFGNRRDSYENKAPPSTRFQSLSAHSKSSYSQKRFY